MIEDVAVIDEITDNGPAKVHADFDVGILARAVPVADLIGVPPLLLVLRNGLSILLQNFEMDLVHMKLTSYRLKDQVHVQDLDHAGLITRQIEQTLSAPLLARLKEVRSKR